MNRFRIPTRPASPQVEGENEDGKAVIKSSTVNPDVKVTNMQPGVTYTFRITAANQFGKGPTKRVTYKVPGKKVVASGSIPAGRRLKA